jgi:hypothetical protein
VWEYPALTAAKPGTTLNAALIAPINPAPEAVNV